MRNFWNRRQVDLERELRARRPRPRPEFVETLAAEVRSRPADRSRAGRIGLVFAMSGLILIVLASFGGIGYASSAVSHSVKKQTVQPQVKHVSSPSAAQAQYGDFTPPGASPQPPTTTTPSKPSGGTSGGTSGGGTEGGTASSGGQAAGTEGTSASSGTGGTSSNLPFTGLALWVPLAIGLALIATGLVLRTRGRRQDSGAQS